MTKKELLNRLETAEQGGYDCVWDCVGVFCRECPFLEIAKDEASVLNHGSPCAHCTSEENLMLNALLWNVVSKRIKI